MVAGLPSFSVIKVVGDGGVLGPFAMLGGNAANEQVCWPGRPALLLLAGDAVGHVQLLSQPFKLVVVDHSARCLDDDGPGGTCLGVNSASDFHHTKSGKPLPQRLNSALRRAVLVESRFTIAEQHGGRQVFQRLERADRFFA